MPLITGVRDDSYLYMNFDSGISGNIPGVITSTGTASISTSVTKVGAGAVDLPSTSITLNKDQRSLLDFKTNDFTISFWVYLKSTPASPSALLTLNYQTSPAGIYAGLLIYTTSATPLLHMSSNGSSWDIANGVSTGGAIPLTTWTHVEVCRSGNRIMVFRNGVLASTTISTLAPRYTNVATAVNALAFYQAYAPCYMDEFLMINGKCLHTENFTPPTDPYTITSSAYLDVPGYEFSEVYPDGGLTIRIKNVLRVEQLEGVGSLTRQVRPVLRLEQLGGLGLRTQGVRDINTDTLMDIEYDSTRSSNREGYIDIEEYQSDRVTTVRGGYTVLEEHQSGRVPTVRDTFEVETFDFDSSVNNKFKLTVTPTHQHRDQVVNVKAVSYQNNPLGNYKVSIGDTALIPYGSTNTNLSSIEFNINPDALGPGVNRCTIDFSGDISGYIQFNITKEALKREHLERTFLVYDGGYKLDNVELTGTAKLIPGSHIEDYTVSDLGIGKKYTIKLGNYVEKVEVL